VFSTAFELEVADLPFFSSTEKNMFGNFWGGAKNVLLMVMGVFLLVQQDWNFFWGGLKMFYLW
jgi:hypothetical protein